jgi:hypothetical protein
VGVAAEDHDQQRGESRQHEDTVGEHEALAETRELTRDEAITRDSDARRGKSANDVLAASTRMRAVEAWIR